MKKTLILFAAFLFCVTLNAQELTEIDVKVAQYPQTFNEPEELADLINKDFDTETDKARAIYSWITMNVEYDVKAYFAKKKKTKRLKYKNAVDRANKIRNREIKLENGALKEHKATAEGYAALYKRVCDLTGIYGYILKGTLKAKPLDIGIQPRMQNHTWNVVQMDKKWFFVDATLGAGSVDYAEKTYQHNFNARYFFTPPEKFFLNHFPKDKGWLLIEKTPEDFANLPLFSGEYLKNDLELIEPINGVLNLKGQDSIQFRIKSPTTISSLTYLYSFEDDAIEIPIDYKNGEYIFSIPFTLKRRGFISLFYNKMPIVSYKIGAY